MFFKIYDSIKTLGLKTKLSMRLVGWFFYLKSTIILGVFF